jgi:hypothetical protein
LFQAQLFFAPAFVLQLSFCAARVKESDASADVILKAAILKEISSIFKFGKWQNLFVVWELLQARL